MVTSDAVVTRHDHQLSGIAICQVEVETLEKRHQAYVFHQTSRNEGLSGLYAYVFHQSGVKARRRSGWQTTSVSEWA
jgi:hypothetical protein